VASACDATPSHGNDLGGHGAGRGASPAASCRHTRAVNSSAGNAHSTRSSSSVTSRGIENVVIVSKKRANAAKQRRNYAKVKNAFGK
jgi:hypothetical protein